MSLLDNPPHIARVYLSETITDSRGNEGVGRSSTSSVLVRCRMQPISAGRDPGTDRRIGDREAYRFSARSAPLGTWSKVEWDGKVFHVESGPFRHDETPAVTRVTCTLLRES